MSDLPYYCPEAGGDAKDGIITIRGLFGETKRRRCTKWANHECSACASDTDDQEESGEPRELFE